jgi:hypothetical protein
VPSNSLSTEAISRLPEYVKCTKGLRLLVATYHSLGARKNQIAIEKKSNPPLRL